MNQAWTIRIGLLAMGVSASLTITTPAQAQSAESYFRQNCSMCHTIGGGHLIGPDLEGVAKRKDRAWLVKFMLDPKAVIDSKDPYAAQLLEDAHGLVMPTGPGMTTDLANSLLDYAEGKAGGTTAEALGPVVSERPFTDADITLGRQLFSGKTPLADGGPPCVSCHTLGPISGRLGGGRLGPDLTQAFDRLGGRKGLSAWLSSMPTPAMQSLFAKHALQPDEIIALLAVIDDTSPRAAPAGASSMRRFFLFGVVGMLVGLVLIQLAWRGRFRAVRQVMVQGQFRGGQ